VMLFGAKASFLCCKQYSFTEKGFVQIVFSIEVSRTLYLYKGIQNFSQCHDYKMAVRYFKTCVFYVLLCVGMMDMTCCDICVRKN
jgi:hypothetical protein